MTAANGTATETRAPETPSAAAQSPVPVATPAPVPGGRTERYLRGTAYSLANTLAATVGTMWLTSFLVGRMGREDYGLWLTALQVTGLLNVLDLGVTALLPRDAAAAVGRAGDGGWSAAADLPGIVARARRAVYIQTPLAGVAAAVCWWALSRVWPELSGPMAVALSAFTLAFPLRMYLALLTGLQDLATVGRLSLLGTAVWIAGAASLTAAGWGLYSPAAAWAASQAVPGLLAWRRVRSAYPGLDSGPAPAGPSGRELADLWGRGLLVTVSQFAVNLLRGGGMLVAGLAASPAAAAVYSCTAKLSELPQNYLQLGVGAALPGLSELRGGSDPARVARVATAMSSATLLLSGLASLTFLAVNEAFVGWWLGPELYGGLTLTALLAAGSLLWSWNVALAFGCYAFNRDLPLVMGTLGAAAASPAFGALLTNLSVGGPEAAAAGFLLALATVALPVNLWVLSDSSGVAATVLLRAWAPFFARLIPLWVAVWTVRGRWGPSGVAEALAASMAVAVVYGAVMWSLLGDECLAPYAGVVFDRLRLPRSWLPARAGAEARA